MKKDKHEIQYHLLYDPEQKHIVEKKLIPLFEGKIERSKPFSQEPFKELGGVRVLLLYLSDAQIKELLPEFVKHPAVVAVLPHPDATEACAGFGVDSRLDKAVQHIIAHRSPIKTDVLYCNGRPVLNHLVIGQTFNLIGDNKNEQYGFLKRKWQTLVRFFKIIPFRVDIRLANDKEIQTSVAGIVVSEHRKSSFLTRLFLEDSSISDGRMHAFLILPRSIIEMFVFALRALWTRNQLPPFAAHIKTHEITFSFPGHEKKMYVVDKEEYVDAEIHLKIAKEKIEIIPGAYLSLPDSSKNASDIYRVSALPTGDAAREVAGHTIPIIRHASSDEFKDLFQVLRDNARLKSSFLVLMVISTVLATFGLFANSTPVVIGAMILAPLMSPIISLSMGALRQDRNLISNSITTILAGLLLSVMFAVLITWLIPIDSAGTEIMNRTRPNLLDLGIAVVSGIAGAYAHAREEVAKTLAGVAIAVALIPPLAVAAIGIAWWNWNVFFGAALLLSTNLAGMVLAASFTFMLLGFSPFKLASKGMVISLALVLVLSIPLALGFNQMLYEHRMKTEIEAVEHSHFMIREVQVQSVKPLRISFKLVSSEIIDKEDIREIKWKIEEAIGKPAEMEVVTAILK